MLQATRGRPRLRSRLLKAARDLMEAEGVAALTTKAVAERAGVTEATLFNNFGDKRGFLQALVVEATPEFDNLVADIANDAMDIRSWAVSVFHSVLNYYRIVIPLSGQQLLSGPVAPRTEKDPKEYAVHYALSSRLKELQRDNYFPEKVDADVSTLLFLGAAMLIVVTERTMGSTPVEEDHGLLANRIIDSWLT